MKKITIVAAMLLSANLFAQTPPQGTPPASNTAARAAAAWYRGGNFASGTNPTGANIFGTLWNSPIYTYTAGTNRLRLNGNVNYTVNQVNKSFSGYMGIGPNGYFATHTPLAYLHLEGPNSTNFTGNGWRAWMETGVFMKRQSDAMYVGLLDLGANRADAIINWSDDPTGGNNVDKLRFLFTAVAANGNGDNNNPKSGSSKYGYEFMRMVPSQYQTNSAGHPAGYIGIGPVFNNTNAPRSRVHINSEDRLYTWLQITNQNGTGQGPNDGLRLGIRGGGVPFGYLRWQENRPFIVQTDWNNSPGGINNGERLRIVTINAPGVPNPFNLLDRNITRVAISHHGSEPVTKPRSLLHLGYNTGKLSGGGQDGWRKWMDIGMFVGNGTDNTYFGLKEEKGQNNDRYDAVINWGDNQVQGNSLNGPDNLRFIFTSTTTALPPGQGDPVSQSYDGLEIARMAPEKASTMPNTNYGMVGIGNFSPTSSNAPGSPTYIDAKLDIDGDLRIRQITQDDNLNMILVADPNDLNRVHWRDASTLGSGTGWGNFCGNTQNPITNDWEIPLNGLSYNFTADSVKNRSRVNVGDVACATFQPTRLYSKITEVMDSAVKEHAAIIGHANGTNFLFNTSQYGVWGIVNKAYSNASAGVYGISITPQALFTTNTRGHGVKGTSVGATYNVGVYGYADDVNATYNIGGVFEARNAINNYGIYCSAPVVAQTNPNNPPANLALYADGDVYVSGTAYLANPASVISDQMFKTNIDTITDATGIINQLKPKTFNFDTAFSDQVHFPNNKQYGFIAQEVQPVLPDLVTTAVLPEKTDSLGNVIAPAVTYKSLNYNAFIAILTKGIQEQQNVIDSLTQVVSGQDSAMSDVLSRLSALEQCLNNANICNASARVNNNAQNTDFETQVELQNVQGIVLDQNVPNPFAENTIINFFIPEEVAEAQLLFYDSNGKIIKSLTINERGNGKLQVYGENLSNGIYTYTLIADGKIIDTKQMIKTK